MKRKFFTTLILSMGLSMGVVVPTLVIKDNRLEVVEASQHADNFDDYTYGGNYYDNITETGEGLDGSLRQALTSYILPKEWPSYSGSSATSLAVLCQDADEDPTNKNNMIYLYTRDSVKKNGASSWNREHTWPKSISGGCWGEGKAGSDLLHLRPTYNTVNSTRSSIPFGQTSSGEEKVYQGMTWGWIGTSDLADKKVVMPLPSVRGDVARIIMYIWVAYKDYYGSKLPYITNVFDSYETLLKWHMEDKPDALEGHRNDVAEASLQKNRNPFVDHPEYAWMIFGDNVSSATKEACREVYPGNSAKLTSISIASLPTKTEYYINGVLDTDGLKVMGNYDDGTSKDVTAKCTISPTSLPSSPCTQKITVTYGSKSASFNVTVKDYEHVDLSSVKLSVNQEKIFESSQVQLKVTYSPLDTYPYPTISYESSDETIATVDSNGLLSALTPGEVTITVTAIQGSIERSDSLTLVISEKEMPRVEDIYDKEANEDIEFYCQYIGSYPNQYKGIFVGDGDYATLIYGYSSLSDVTPYQTYLKVSGKVDIYSGLYEVKEANIEIVDEAVGKAHVNPVTTYEFDGTEGVPEEGETAEQKVHDQRLILSRPCVIEGTVKSVSTEIAQNNDTSVVMTLKNGKEATVFIKKKSNLDYTTLNNSLGTPGNEAVVKGYIGVYGTTFQLTVPTIVEQKDSYTATSFASDVLSLTNEICSNGGVTSNKSKLIDVWTNLELNYYPQMKQAQRTIFAHTEGSETGSDLEKGVARYDYIVGKYNLKDFADRGVEPFNQNYIEGSYTGEATPIIIVVAIISLMSLSTLLLLRKKRK